MGKSGYSCFGYVEDRKWQRVETNFSGVRFHLSTRPSTRKQNFYFSDKIESSNKCDKVATNHYKKKKKENVLLCLFCEFVPPDQTLTHRVQYLMADINHKLAAQIGHGAVCCWNVV